MLTGMLTYNEYGTLAPIKVRTNARFWRFINTSCATAGTSLLCMPWSHGIMAAGAEHNPDPVSGGRWRRAACQTRSNTSSLALRLQVLAWAAVAVVSVLIVASRKHYSVDVLIAWCAPFAPRLPRISLLKLMFGPARLDRYAALECLDSHLHTCACSAPCTSAAGPHASSLPSDCYAQTLGTNPGNTPRLPFSGAKNP